jgi:DNA-binding CsgD family transcriptional regulator
MDPLAPTDAVARGDEALAAGRWARAREAFEAALVEAGAGAAGAWLGLAVARWWEGENRGSVDACTRAYARFRRDGDVAGAVRCAVWLAITHKANFGEFAPAEGWLGRADRLLAGAGLPPGPLHGWVAIARAYRSDDLAAATAQTEQALALARVAGDVDLELVALAQLGRIRVARGEAAAGFALLDEALAGALAGEAVSLDTVVYACCDMLNACDLATDLARAAQWCTVADDFVERYGCPFLYAECRMLYGGVLVAKGRWDDAERELATALRMTAGSCPALHTRALARLAELRLRQGRLEQADQLVAELGARIDDEAETVLTRAALLLARGDGDGAGRVLTERLDRLADHRLHLAVALATLVDAHLAVGAVDTAATTSARLTALAAHDRAPGTGEHRVGGLATVARDEAAATSLRLTALSTSTPAGAAGPPTGPDGGSAPAGTNAGADRVGGLAAVARGRVALAAGARDAAVAELEAAVDLWTRLDLPYEAAAALLDLAGARAPTHHDLAVEHGMRALATFERLGAAGQADRAAALLRSLGVRARTGPKGVGLLTRREQEVLELLGQGLSNPEIAERLYVSRKTAAHHVSSVLAKLQLRNRAEAAALVARTSPGPVP